MKMAGALGLEPRDDGTKNRCLTNLAMPHPYYYYAVFFFKWQILKLIRLFIQMCMNIFFR
jgi:hypothetical protein